jgi:predicted aldo/keto reductase-like oxidoreductase
MRTIPAEWGPHCRNMNQVGSDCQDNLVAILKQAIDFGINHIETARLWLQRDPARGNSFSQLI